ncbi:NAD(P)/FAD-dependent oxidoreductase [Mesorhizobium mediterraneum]|uniref:NAD(P)/FAD-dependent oxidoreductase n=1 Tax=Mesorhizobium mediterraneum TaxID=43617 RepID=UPI0032B83326
MLMATGIVDKLPDISNAADLIKAGTLRLCPICDGYEVIDKRVAVIGPLKNAMKKALFMRTFTRNLTLLITDPETRDDPHALAVLAREGIEVAACTRDAIRASGPDAIVEFSDGKVLAFDTIYPAMGCTMRSQLAVELGAKCDEVGNLVTDSHQRTNILGLYAAGDVVDEINQIAVAFGHAAAAASDIHNYLANSDRDA